MSSNYVYQNGLSGLAGLKPTDAQLRKIAWQVAREAKQTSLPLIRITGAQLNYGYHGRGRYGQWKEYWTSFGKPVEATAWKIHNSWKRKFPEVYNTNPPKAYKPKSSPNTGSSSHSKPSGGQSSSGGNSTPQPSPNDGSSSSGDSTSQPPQTTAPAATQNANSSWLIWGIGAAALGGLAWFFRPGDEKDMPDDEGKES